VVLLQCGTGTSICQRPAGDRVDTVACRQRWPARGDDKSVGLQASWETMNICCNRMACLVLSCLVTGLQRSRSLQGLIQRNQIQSPLPQWTATMSSRTRTPAPHKSICAIFETQEWCFLTKIFFCCLVVGRYITGAIQVSPRTELVYDHLQFDVTTTACVYRGNIQVVPCNGGGAIRVGDMKLLVGTHGWAGLYGHWSPNASYDKSWMENITLCSFEQP
jgi:hypothetical protein